MGEFGFGIIGCGMISHFQAEAIRESKQGRLVAVASRSEANAKKLTDKFGGDRCASCEELCGRDDVDIVSVCTPSGAHLEPARLAAEAGKHVVVEKPIEITLKRADELIAACSANGVGLCTIFPSRFVEANRLMKATIDSGRSGRLTLGDAYVKWYRTQDYYDSGGWRGTWDLDGGGALINQSIHAIDLLQWFMGDVDTVTALTGTLIHERIEVEDTAVAALRFKNGALGVIEGTTSAYPGFLKRVEVSGADGTAVVEEADITKWEFRDERPGDAAITERMASCDSGGGGAADPAAISFVPHMKQFEDFMESLAEGRPPLVDGAEGRKALEIILAIYRSNAEGRAVRLPLPAE